MLLKTKTTLGTFVVLLLFHEIVSGAPLRVRAVEWLVLTLAFLVPAVLVQNRPKSQKIRIFALFFTLGAIVQFVGFEFTVVKFELHWTVIAGFPLLYLCFGLLHLIDAAAFRIVKRLTGTP
jgi:hypothetical protein